MLISWYNYPCWGYENFKKMRLGEVGFCCGYCGERFLLITSVGTMTTCVESETIKRLLPRKLKYKTAI